MAVIHHGDWSRNRDERGILRASAAETGAIGVHPTNPDGNALVAIDNTFDQEKSEIRKVLGNGPSASGAGARVDHSAIAETRRT